MPYRIADIVCRFAADASPSGFAIPITGLVVKAPTDAKQYLVLEHGSQKMRRWHEATILRAFPNVEALTMHMMAATALASLYATMRSEYRLGEPELIQLSRGIQRHINNLFGA